MRVSSSLDSPASPSRDIVGNVPYNMGEESVCTMSVPASCPERPTGAVDRRLQICRSRRWLQVRRSLCPLISFLTLLQTRLRQGNRKT